MTTLDVAEAPTATVDTTILAFDFGLRRLGVAVGMPALRQAHPLATIDAGDDATRFAAIGRLIEQWRPERLVVGLPRHEDGREHELAPRCRRFARQLRGRFSLPIDLADEFLSSADAESRLRAAGADPRRYKSRIDALAAQVILETYFDAASGR